MHTFQLTTAQLRIVGHRFALRWAELTCRTLAAEALCGPYQYAVDWRAALSADVRERSECRAILAALGVQEFPTANARAFVLPYQMPGDLNGKQGATGALFDEARAAEERKRLAAHIIEQIGRND